MKLKLIEIFTATLAFLFSMQLFAATAYITTIYQKECSSGSVLVVDTNTFDINECIVSGSYTHGIAAHPFLGLVYSANINSDTVACTI